MIRMVICNDGVDSPNKGDEAILRAMLHDLPGAGSGVHISCFSYSGGRRLKNRLGLLWAVARADLFVLGGGHPFQDLTSQIFLLFGLVLIAWAKLTRTRVVCYAVGVGPIQTRWGRSLTRRILNRTDDILVRDPTSRDILASLGVRPNKMTLTADAAFTLPQAPAERVEEILRAEGVLPSAEPLVAVCPRRWFLFRHRLLPAEYYPRREREVEDTGRVTRALVGALDSIVEHHGVRPVFVPSRKSLLPGRDFGQDDDLYSQEIVDAMRHGERAIVLRGDYSPEELKGILCRTDLVISIRMHPAIFATECAVPVVAIPFTRAKGEGLFSLLGLDSYVYIEDVEADTLEKLFDKTWSRREDIRTHLREVRRDLARQAGRNVEVVRRHLRELGVELPSEGDGPRSSERSAVEGRSHHGKAGLEGDRS